MATATNGNRAWRWRAGDVPDLPSINFNHIREHEGSQHRAWEELGYLLARDLDDLPSGVRLERLANPDGGIEFSCEPAGRGNGRWAWQAKFLFRFDDSTFRQMHDSFRDALESTPDLVRYIFLLPKDLTGPGRIRWATKKAEWEAEATANGRSVDLVFHGHSDFVTALLADQHAAAVRYFMDDTVLTDEHCRTQVAAAVVNLGQRYDPRVNVETEARNTIDGATRNQRFVDETVEILSSPLGDRVWTGETIADEDAEKAATAALSAFSKLRRAWGEVVEGARAELGEPGDAVFHRLRTAAKVLADGLEAETRTLQKRIDASRATSTRALERRRKRASTGDVVPPTPKRTGKVEEAEKARVAMRQRLGNVQSALWSAQGATEQVLAYLDGPAVQAAVAGSVLMVGEAGCGKSHLVADLATERVGGGTPTLLLLGELFTPGNVGPQIVSHAQLRDLTLDELLATMDVAARVRRKGRALLAIDAINEGAGADLWHSQLPGFLDAIRRFDWVSVVVTIRDVYESDIITAPRAGTIRVNHPGLAGHEEEALTLYAQHYGLRTPDVPALVPELTNPLFLRTLCVSVVGHGLDAIPRDATNVVWVFDGLLAAVNAAVSKPARLDIDPTENRVGAAVRALAAAMVDADSEHLALHDAKAVCQVVHPSIGHSKSLLHALVVEGILLQERVQRDGTPTESVRFTYQRLSDHLRADVFLERYPGDAELAAAVKALARDGDRWSHRGLIAALVLLVPERRSKELAKVLKLTTAVDRYADRRAPMAWLRAELQEAFVDTLVWRSPSTFTPAADELLQRYFQANAISAHEWLTILASLACVPDHPLNCLRLDAALMPMEIADRDMQWTKPLLSVYSDDGNPVSRTIDWAWTNPSAPVEVSRLTGLLLGWLLTSTNRRLRDTATKALVSITTGKSTVMAELVSHFAAVNDLYVLDRVVAAAYGHMLRHRHHVHDHEIDDLISVGEAVFDAVYGATEPTTHLQLRHRARMCSAIAAGLADAHGRTFNRDVTATIPPYGSPWPLKAPSAKTLAAGYDRKYDTYLATAVEVDWDSIENMERYVVTGFLVPDQPKAKAARRKRLEKAFGDAWTEFVEALPPSKRKTITARLLRMLALDHRQRVEQERFEASLSKTAREKLQPLRRALSAVRNADEPVHPDANLCSRWVAARVLELGWTKERFGDSDQSVRRYRSDSVTDPVSKKYENIAFLELMGHLTDHCLITSHYREDPSPYAGPWDVRDVLDLDPSNLVRGDQPGPGTTDARIAEIRRRPETRVTWWRTFSEHQLNPAGSDSDWLSDTSDVPPYEQMLSAIDAHGREWVALERHHRWSLADTSVRERGGYRPDRREMWFRSQSNLIRADDTVFAPWAANTNWMGLSAVSTAMDVYEAGLGEYPDLDPWPYHLNLRSYEHRPWPEEDPGTDVLPWGWEWARMTDERAAYRIATVNCHQDSGTDLSASDTRGAILPSELLLDLMSAKWTGGALQAGADYLDLGPVEREWSWAAGGEVVAFCTTQRGYNPDSALWVLAEPLRAALAGADLGLWSWMLGEKIFWNGSNPSTIRADLYGATRLAPGPTLLWGFTIDRDRDRTRSGGGSTERVTFLRASGIEATPLRQAGR